MAGMRKIQGNRMILRTMVAIFAILERFRGGRGKIESVGFSTEMDSFSLPILYIWVSASRIEIYWQRRYDVPLMPTLGPFRCLRQRATLAAERSKQGTLMVMTTDPDPPP